ncbi:hypothetical protein DLM75_12965 [Leptospira stimsonii]|uniref:Uncharacterized protein n=1 Tax=Leptospira stimsonii TaxID=2202203 RepID=A0A396Z9Q1_9LEPT|nr:hypothetical protein DLM75_12965 [Leptospira stimsonii]
MFRKTNKRPFSRVLSKEGYLWSSFRLLNKAEQVLIQNKSLRYYVVNRFFHLSIETGENRCIR